MKDWKTTTLGILTIAGALINAAVGLFNGHPVNYPITFSALTTGVGLIKAADSSK